MKWDITVDAQDRGIRIAKWAIAIGREMFKIVQPATVEAVRTGTRLAVTEDPLGTLHDVFNEDYPLPIAVAGKTGTAEYCDDVATQGQSMPVRFVAHTCLDFGIRAV